MVPNISIPAVPDVGTMGTRKGERELTYSLLVQKMQGGKPVGTPFRLASNGVLQSGWKFSFDFSSPQSGYLYLVDDPEKGAPGILFPNPKVNNGEAQLTAKNGMQIGPYNLDQNPGREKLWIVWSSLPVFELQLAAGLMKNPNVARYAAKDAVVPQIQSFIRNYQDAGSQAQTQPSDAQVKLLSHTDPLVYAVELEHR